MIAILQLRIGTVTWQGTAADLDFWRKQLLSVPNPQPKGN